MKNMKNMLKSYEIYRFSLVGNYVQLFTVLCIIYPDTMKYGYATTKQMDMFQPIVLHLVSAHYSTFYFLVYYTSSS